MTGPFRGRTVVRIALLAGASFAVALALLLFQDELQETRSAAANTFSRSALGHRAWTELLRRTGRPVVVARNLPATAPPRDAVLVIAEPVTGARPSPGIHARAAGARRLLVVLPKRRGEVLAERPSWVDRVEILRPALAESVLRDAGISGTVERPAAPIDAAAWRLRGVSAAPTLDDVQLVRSRDLVPIVDCSSGILVGRVTVDGREIVVLSDPDVIANHGIHRGDNALLATELVALHAPRGSAVVFDETLHGFGASSSLFRELFTFPLSLAVLQAALAVGALLWAGIPRFGAPRAAAPALGAGRHTLVANTADLLVFGGHAGHVVARYFDRAVETVAVAASARQGESDGSRAEKISGAREAARRRGAREDLDVLAAEVAAFRSSARRTDDAASERHAVALARRIRAWREEALDGTK